MSVGYRRRPVNYMELLGRAYGENAKQVRQKRVVNEALQVLGGNPDTVYVLVNGDEDHDDGQLVVSYRYRTLKELLYEVLDTSRPSWSFEDLSYLRTVPQAKRLNAFLVDAGEMLCNICLGIYTKAEHEAKMRDKLRKEIEGLAVELAHRYNCKVNSLEFIDACYKELGHFEYYREGMREDGLCIGYGVTGDQWLDEFNESQGDTHRINSILGWIEEFSPLLWMEYQHNRSEPLEED